MFTKCRATTDATMTSSRRDPTGSSALRTTSRAGICRSSKAMRPGTDRRGFTLIELLVIIIIIAVVSSIVVPSYSRFYARARFQAAVRDVRDLLASAREQAVTGDTT